MLKRVLFVALMATASSAAWAAGSKPVVFSFGIVPQQAASKLAKTWGPILSYVSKKTGYRLEFATAKDIPTFEQNLIEGKYDFSYMNPYHYTVFHRVSGYNALAKARDKRIKGIIVVRKASDIKALKQLAGAGIAFPSPAAFAASILTRGELNSRHIAFTAHYVSSHDSVYRDVAAGLFKAGGGVVRTFEAVDPAVRAKLRVLWTTAGYTPHAIAANSRVPKAVVQRVQAALVGMDETPEGRRLLAPLKITGWEAAKDADWDDVRSLHIHQAVGLHNK